MEENVPLESTYVSKQSKSKPFLLVGLCAVLVIASASGVYYWQHQKLAKANADIAAKNTQISKLNGNATSLQGKLSALQNQYNQAKATLDSYQAAARKAQSSIVIATQGDLQLTVNGAQYVNPAGTVTAGGKWFGVNVTLTNNTSNAISVNDSDFHLKDLQNNEFPESTIQGADTLPAGWVSLPNKTIAPGETLDGTVTFQMTSDSVKAFNFVNVTKSYPVSSSN